MTQRSSATKPKKSSRSMPAPPDDYQNSGLDLPAASPQVINQNRLPTFIVMLINLVIIYLGTLLLDKWITLPCVTSQGSALGLACLLLMVFHMIWRFAYPVMAEKKEEGTVKLPVIEIPLSVLISILNAAHPWKLKRFGFVFFLLVLGSVMILNLTNYSPFRATDGPFAIQSFSVRRSFPPAREELAPGDMLTMTVGETVIVDVMLLGDTQVSCTWLILTKPNTIETGCSIDYSALTPGVDDILSVYVQPACGPSGKSESLFIAVQP